MSKTILFYSSVSDLSLFKTQKFYEIDIELLKNLGFNIVLTNKIKSFLKFREYDISFLYFYKWSFLPAIISRLFHKKTYFTGGIDDLSKNHQTRTYKKQRILFKICYLMATKCFIVSNADKENILKIIKKDKKNKLILSLHTIDVSKFDKQLISYDKRQNFITIAWMNSLENVKRKGIDRALFLFSELCKLPDFVNSLFYIAGTEGDGSAYLRTLIDQYGIKDKVIFLGNINEEKKVELLNHTKYYFQLSEYEGFGLAAIEALASGCIVIHSGQGGLKDGIAEDGIKINIYDTNENQLTNLREQIINFDINKLQNGFQRLLHNFSNERRQCDFEIIENS